MSRAVDRRAARRTLYTRGHLPPAARIRPGTPITIVNLSTSGALVEGALRCKPGARCELVLSVADGKEQSLRSRIVRCFVARLGPSMVRYRTALAFEHPGPAPVETLLRTGYELPNPEAATEAGRVAASHREGGDAGRRGRVIADRARHRGR